MADLTGRDHVRKLSAIAGPRAGGPTSKTKRAGGKTAGKPKGGPPKEGWWEVCEDKVPPGAPRDIFFGVVKSGAPPNVQALKADVERTLSSLRLLYPVETAQAKFDQAFVQLLSLADLGLCGRKPAVSEAAAALDSLKTDIVNREAGRIKNRYMLQLGAWAVLFGILSAMLFFIFEQWPNLPSDEVYRYRHVFLVWSGCMAGAWASFAGRKVTLGFFDLSNLEEDRIDPALRLLFTAVLTTFLVLMVTSGFANIIIGGFDASHLLSSGSVALLIGAFAGLSEKGAASGNYAKGPGAPRYRPRLIWEPRRHFDETALRFDERTCVLLHLWHATGVAAWERTESCRR
ncbi:MAG: hypothetical protein QOH04_871 [Sphingomonadales bacterium]|nr:hypothetical protein [Sphingomonadales bacterium]